MINRLFLFNLNIKFDEGFKFNYYLIIVKNKEFYFKNKIIKIKCNFALIKFTKNDKYPSKRK